MTSGYQIPTRRGAAIRLASGIDDFMNWLQFGYETWLLAVLKAVTLFLFMYFLLFYVPNYVYYAVTLYVLDFSKDVGFLVANIVGGTTFVVLIILAVWTQAARGRSGFGWSLIRFLNFFQLLGAVLVIIPFMVFNLAGGSLVPLVLTAPGVDASAGLVEFLSAYRALLLGMVTAGLGAASLVFLFFEYRRITRREARAAVAAGSAWQTGG